MTAMFTVIFLEQWLKEKHHISEWIGLGASIGCLLIFGADNFLIPTMICILVALTILEKKPWNREKRWMQHDFITTDHYYCYVCSRNYADTFSAICSLQFQTSNAAIHSIFRKSTAWCDFFHAGGLLPATCFLTAGQSWITGADRNSSDSWTSPVEKTNVVVYCRRYGLLYASYPVYLLRKRAYEMPHLFQK